MAASFQVAVNPETYREVINDLPTGWVMEASPMLGPDGQMLMQVHDPNAPEHLHGKRITVAVRREPGGALTVVDYTALGEQWQGDRPPADRVALLDRLDEMPDPLQVIAVALGRAIAAGARASQERDELRGRVDELEQLTRGILRTFYERGGPGVGGVRSGWVREEVWRQWKYVLDGG